MGSRGIAHWSWVVVAAWAWSAAARTLCPPRCSCDDALRAASCANAGLEIVPIQLNPEATYINLTHNSIDNLLYSFAFYTQITILDISYNKVQDLGSKNFDSNIEMTNLNVSHNGLRKLDKDTFVGLKRLMDLDLSNNELSIIHAQTFQDLAVLERLDLSNNKLVNFEIDTFVPLSSLKVLSLRNNSILEIPSTNLLTVIYLEFLDLSENLIQQIPKHGIPYLKELRHLDLNNNIIEAVDHLGFHNLPSLRHLDLSDNNMTSVPTSALSKLTNLTHLYLSGNFIQKIPSLSFQSLFHLKHLHLSRLFELDKIDSRAFVDNINLQKIWMNENLRVHEVPPRLFHGNPKLTHIYMRNNALETLDASHFPIDTLQELEISGNPFVCNCSLLWLWKLVGECESRNKKFDNTSTVLKIDYEDVKCAAPEHLKSIRFIQIPESEYGCSSGWVVVAIVVMTISIIISIVGGVLFFFGPLKKCKGDKSKQVMTSVILNGDVSKLGNSLVYTTRGRENDNKREVDRYLMIGSSVTNNFHTLNPPWQSMDKSPYYQEDNEEHIYQQFAYETIPPHRTPEKPHIVYV
ncbi:leucine-rich repeat-containing G-protein coupled receptor 4-like [Leptidea sinapis]|uniref:leucine-rich repeat-containing G-protein coupled receptor 4-like n=1 Tax=Leptidea sinapis TaxID=189913 RepID=UPI0021430915|nr:leucine-rich repeat-containing G-protein coupled receptor 4-like [Leptidea sinapis]XP_050671007.1 leucine-rich repeat-containing G-protein coupled receptor 4-like [Leptidea sinapis]XP_050671008.1 leucine-rich repeat-containing G-protein coupled receptor 4-like [Leptidea sinapis]XP_050671009.1 leucine-rich repeat-containing G-protein coupled receptor 4-like [Leptidea sinapis]